MNSIRKIAEFVMPKAAFKQLHPSIGKRLPTGEIKLNRVPIGFKPADRPSSEVSRLMQIAQMFKK